ncbi:MAG: TlpA disulfide reductase family protein [Candidatus Neomarinimicrobiota bacterium]
MKRLVTDSFFRGVLHSSRLLPAMITGVFLVYGSGQDAELTLREIRASDILEIVQLQKDSGAVLVNFWATWCRPCVEEFPMIINLSENYPSSDLTIYLVSVDWLDEKEKVVTFLTNHGISGLSFIKNQGDDEFINAIWKEWTGAIPFNIVYGKETGNVIDFWEGKQPVTRFERAIGNALDNQHGGSS